MSALELARCIAAARIVMPRSVVRLSAGRIAFSGAAHRAAQLRTAPPSSAPRRQPPHGPTQTRALSRAVKSAAPSAGTLSSAPSPAVQDTDTRQELLRRSGLGSWLGRLRHRRHLLLPLALLPLLPLLPRLPRLPLLPGWEMQVALTRVRRLLSPGRIT